MKIVNPQHDDVFREEIANFISRISNIINKKGIKEDIDFREIIDNSGRFSFLNEINYKELKHPFSEDLINFVRNDMIIPIIYSFFKNMKIDKPLLELIIQNTLKLFIHQALDIIKKYPNIETNDIEINNADS